jgi:hypothetical protein
MFTRARLYRRPAQDKPLWLRVRRAVGEVALEGFLSFLEGATLDWLSHRGISRAALQDLLLTVAPVVPAAAAAAADPTMGLDAEAAASMWNVSKARQNP